jgi:hypothetical protein
MQAYKQASKSKGSGRHREEGSITWAVSSLISCTSMHLKDSASLSVQASLFKLITMLCIWNKICSHIILDMIWWCKYCNK